MPNYSHATKLSLASAEEPPYLDVGTDVSAKYKGAFCEAKIIDVNKHVKLRVLFDGSSGSYLIDDSDLKAGATLETGGKIEAKHPEKKQQTYVQATITKILDHSRYTVVFDDGDQCILRRNSLCLKSGKHFAESETLDQLPLTNPEHFGNPVKVGAFEQQQQQQQNNHQQASNNPKNSNNNNNNSSSDNNQNSNSGQVSSIASNRLQNNIKHEAEKQAKGKVTTPASANVGRRGVKGRKRRESVNNGSKHAQDPDNDSIDSCPDSADAETSESNVRYDLIEIGVKLMVQYGKGKVQNVYEAKVNKIETTAAGKTRYFVHYTGWNNRYDEWVTKNRIVSIVTEKENGTKDGRSRQSESNSTVSTNSNLSASSSATNKESASNREKDKEKEKEISSKTRRSRQSENVTSSNLTVASTTATITTLTTTVATTTTTTGTQPSSSESSAPSSQPSESQQLSQSPVAASKSEPIATTVSRPTATSARQHRQRGDNLLATVTTTTTSTVTTPSTLSASSSTISTASATTTASTAAVSTTTTTNCTNVSSSTTKSQRTTHHQQQPTTPSQAVEAREQATVGRPPSGRRGRALVDRLSRESLGEKLTNSVGRRGGNQTSSRAASRASTTSTVQIEAATNQVGQLSGRRIKCPECGAGRCRCRGRRQLLSPLTTATTNSRESPSPPQLQQMSSASQKPPSPVPSLPTVPAVRRTETDPSSASIDPQLEAKPSTSNSALTNSKAPVDQSLVQAKAEPAPDASDSPIDQTPAEPAKEAHVTLATTATSTRDIQRTSSVSISHSTSGSSSVTTAAETSVISDGIGTRDSGSNCDSIGSGSTSSSSASSRSEISDRRGSTSTAASNNVELISATSASNLSASSSTRQLYSFCDYIEEPDCDKKISILQDRIMALRHTYMSLKTELADLDRRRKRPRTERSNSEHLNCSVTCRN